MFATNRRGLLLVDSRLRDSNKLGRLLPYQPTMQLPSSTSLWSIRDSAKASMSLFHPGRTQTSDTVRGLLRNEQLRIPGEIYRFSMKTVRAYPRAAH